MTLETLTKAEAEAKPAGEGREDPNKNPTLEEPKYVCNNLRGAGNFIVLTIVCTTIMTLKITPIFQIFRLHEVFRIVEFGGIVFDLIPAQLTFRFRAKRMKQ